MKFSELAKYLQKLEETTKRLEITDILTDLISNLSPQETDKAIYLASGHLESAFAGVKFNIAEKMMTRIIEQAFSTLKETNLKGKVSTLYKKYGDLGSVVFELKKSGKSDLSITKVYSKLLEITKIEGTGSQEQKATKACALIKELDPLSAKYVTRIILDTMRLGFTELTIIASLANLLKDKKLAKKIEFKFYIYPDIGLIAKKIKTDGMGGVEKIDVETGVPILSQRCQRVSGIEEIPERIKNMWAEFKFDGTRIQMHFDKNKKPNNDKD
ncbi:MAG: hypothetical protein ABIJ82_01680, partial [Patescibacteria group bacterium]